MKIKGGVFWKNPRYKIRPALKKDIECDYLIIGGGITGVSLAYFLSKNNIKNEKIVLIEKNSIGGGATGKSAGILTIKAEIDLHQLIERYGNKKAVIYWKANQQTLNLIKKIIFEEKINCEFEQQNTILAGMFGGDSEYIIKEYKTEKIIDPKSKLLDKDLIKKEINTEIFKHALLSHDYGISVNPLKHVQSLSRVIEKYRARVYEKTPLISVNKNIAKTPKAKIKFKKIILALDYSLKVPVIEKNRSTVIVTEKLTKKQLKKTGLLKKKIIWDSEDEYNYLKVTKDNRILLGFGDKIIKKDRGHNLPNKQHLNNMKSFLNRLFPYLQLNIEYSWSANYGVTKNKISLINIKDNKIQISGGGSQVACVMISKYISDKLTRKKSVLDGFFR